MGVRHYKDLIAWQLADEFKLEAFKLAARPSVRRDLKFASQLVASARAPSKDIAEGFRRFSAGAFRQFLDYALASLAEAEEHVRDGVQLSYFTESDCAEALQLARRCTVATLRLKRSLARSP